MKKLLAIVLVFAVVATAYAINFGTVVVFNAQVAFRPIAVTIADNGNGGTAAASTLTAPLGATYHYTCSDANGCDLTLGETGVINGQLLCVINVGTNAVNLADTSGVSETAGAFAAGQYGQICYAYTSDRWVERSRSNN